MRTANIIQKVRHVPLIWKIDIKKAAKVQFLAVLYTLGINRIILLFPRNRPCQVIHDDGTYFALL